MCSLPVHLLTRVRMPARVRASVRDSACVSAPARLRARKFASSRSGKFVLPHARTRRARCLVAIVILRPIISTGAPGGTQGAAANVDAVNTNSREVRVAKVEAGAKALHPHIVSLARRNLGGHAATCRQPGGSHKVRGG